MDTVERKRPKKEDSRRTFTLIWSLLLGGQTVKVSFFFAVLGMKPNSDGAVRSALFKKDIPMEFPAPDGRGRSEPPNKFSEEQRKAMVEHIESFNPMEHHYHKKHAPLRRYLPIDVIIAQIHREFVKDKFPVSHESYRKIVRQIFHFANWDMSCVKYVLHTKNTRRHVPIKNIVDVWNNIELIILAQENNTDMMPIANGRMERYVLPRT